METSRSFYKIFKGYLILTAVAIVGLTFQVIYFLVTRSSLMFTLGIIVFAIWFLYSLWSGLQDRDFRDWNRVVIEGDSVAAYKPFGRKVNSVDVSFGRYVYWAKVWVPKERGMAMPILVLSNEPFSLPDEPDRLFRTVYNDKTQLLIADCDVHPSEWFPQAELQEVTQKYGENIWL